VNVNTKGGTNSPHGSAYEFNQVSLLEANGFFANKMVFRGRPIISTSAA
jgi:hypothetical protein